MLLATRDKFKFYVTKEFKGEFLIPIIENLKVKYQNNFDDYDEVYHCNQLIHQLNQEPDISIDYHVMYLDEQYVGFVMVSSGKIDANKFFNQPLFKTTESAVVLNYFHICTQGRGNGTYWLKEIILPYYQDKEVMYLKSSHARAFSLYQRLGKEIAQYQSDSHNHDYHRVGKIFEIRIDKE